MILVIFLSLGCGKDSNGEPAPSNQTIEKEVEQEKIIDERAAINEWITKMDNTFNQVKNDMDTLYNSSCKQIADGELVEKKDELKQIYKTAHHNLELLNNKLIADEKMYRGITIPSGLSDDKKGEMLKIQNLYADYLKNLREAVCVLDDAIKTGQPSAEAYD